MALTKARAGIVSIQEKILSITAGVNGVNGSPSNGLTVTLNPTTLDFRSTSLTSGAISTINVPTAISLTISSGSTLGTVNAVTNRLAVLAINNAGSVELAVVNFSGGTQLDETNLISTTAEGGLGAADSASVIYSNTARSNVAYRVVGYIESTQATAGVWVTTPSKIQGVGGQALAAMASIGHGQTWQNMSGLRVNGTTYYNTTGKPIMVAIYTSSATGNNFLYVNGSLVQGAIYANTGCSMSTIVPSGSSYYLTGIAANWFELR